MKIIVLKTILIVFLSSSYVKLTIYIFEFTYVFKNYFWIIDINYKYKKIQISNTHYVPNFKFNIVLKQIFKVNFKKDDPKKIIQI